MDYTKQSYDSLRREVHRMVERKLVSLGIYARIFSRIKDPHSTRQKLAAKGEAYRASGKKMQDFLGIRVTLYFEDDIAPVAAVLKANFAFDSESVDALNHENFSPKRHNIVFRMPGSLFERNPDRDWIDNTFEVQIRTIFSEGWHEIEHDLRYRNKEQWDRHPAQSRGLNSILATLEMCDWGISKLTNDMAYNAYATGDLHSLMMNKFRLRLVSTEIDDFFLERQSDRHFLKRVLRANRGGLLDILAMVNGEIPVTANNVLWILAKTQEIVEFPEDRFPPPLRDVFDDYNLW